MGLIWGIVLSVLGLVAAVLIPTAARIVADDFKEWSPWITRRLIQRAVSRLPESERERTEEEWWSDVNEWPGNLAKIYRACGYLSASRSIGNIVRSDSPVAGRIQEAVRRIMDLMVATTLLCLVFPILGIVALCIKYDSPGPVFSRLPRIGQNGREFQLWKFRSMTSGGTGDPRPTRVGAFLRRTKLDDLPQFFNVLRGDMSLVGPKALPYRAAHDKPDEDVEGLRVRAKVKPGLTGWAQVNHRGDPWDSEDTSSYDADYMERRSLWFDLRIVLLTVVRVLTTRS